MQDTEAMENTAPAGDPAQDAGAIVAAFDLNDREELRVRVSLYKGVAMVDTRRWYSAKDGMRPGKGLTVPAWHLPRLIEALQQAQALFEPAPAPGPAGE